MAFAGTEHNLTTSLINTNFVARNNCFRSSLKSPDSLPFWFFSCVQFCSTRTALTVKTFLQNFHRPLCHQSKFSLGGFPRSVGFFFSSFSNRRMSKDSGLVTNCHRICSSGQRCQCKGKTYFETRMTLHSKTFHHLYQVNAAAFPVLFARTRSGWTCKSRKKAGCKAHHPSPTELELVCSIETSFQSFKNILPSSPVATSRLVS